MCGLRSAWAICEQPLERLDRVAPRAQIQGDEIGLAARQHSDRRRASPKWPPLWSSVSAAWTVPSPPLMTSSLGLTRAMVLIASPIWLGPLDLIMEDVRMRGAKGADARQLGDIPGRARVGQQGDPRARHQDIAA